MNKMINELRNEERMKEMKKNWMKWRKNEWNEEKLNEMKKEWIKW